MTENQSLSTTGFRSKFNLSDRYGKQVVYSTGDFFEPLKGAEASLFGGLGIDAGSGCPILQGDAV